MFFVVVFWYGFEGGVRGRGIENFRVATRA